MSYILEALKKAQAERQLGETPTIHAPTLDTGAQRTGSAARLPLAAAVGVMGAVIAGLVGVLWYQASQTAPVAAPAVLTPAAPPPPVAVLPAPAPAPAPVARAPVKPPEPVAAAAAAKPAPEPAPKPADKSADKPQEEPVQALRDLPEPIQRAIPPVAMSGYMYSPNPADRMILIDKVLRREGDEVAPGVVLARLEPKGAVFTFRGYRYRVPY